MIQRAHRDARVVKSLNTMNNSLMVDPQRLGEDTTVFVSGDDADAKATVTELLRAIGHGDVIDLGGLETARDAEMWLRWSPARRGPTAAPTSSRSSRRRRACRPVRFVTGRRLRSTRTATCARSSSVPGRSRADVVRAFSVMDNFCALTHPHYSLRSSGSWCRTV